VIDRLLDMLLNKDLAVRLQALELCETLPPARWLASAPEGARINPESVRGMARLMFSQGVAADLQRGLDLLGNIIDLETGMENLYHFFQEGESYRVRGMSDNSGVHQTCRANMRAWVLERQGVLGGWYEVAKTYLPNSAGMGQARKQLGV